jgi:hypothetical protein
MLEHAPHHRQDVTQPRRSRSAAQIDQIKVRCEFSCASVFIGNCHNQVRRCSGQRASRFLFGEREVRVHGPGLIGKLAQFYDGYAR